MSRASRSRNRKRKVSINSNSTPINPNSTPILPQFTKGVELNHFMEIMYMFCKKSSKDVTNDEGSTGDGRRKRHRGGGSDEGGDKKSNFLLERIFTVFEKRNDEVMNLREFTRGLHTLCRGSQEARLKLFFQIYDLDGG